MNITLPVFHIQGQFYYDLTLNRNKSAWRSRVYTFSDTHTQKKSLLLPSILRPLSEQWLFVPMTSMSFHCQFYISHQNDYRWELFLKNQLFFSHVVKYNCREFLQIIVVFVICMMRRRMRLRSDVVKWFNFSFCIFDFSL